MNVLPLYRTKILPEWIDYNGHLRDAYYSLIFSYATDEMMDQIGLDEAYRTRTRCTLYSLEIHLHYLHEVKKTDALSVQIYVLGVDHKCIHVGAAFLCDRVSGPVATAEAMMLHVLQAEKPASAALPAPVQEKLASLLTDADTYLLKFPGSRKIELRRR